VYDAVKADVHLASISGGTDLCGCFVGSDPTGPVWAGEIQRPALGMAVGVAADDGHLLGPGEKGELVCTAPFPSLPIGFWGDDDGSRYRAAYFDKHPGMWSHGDFASWTEHGGIVIHGRSDATLNPGGVRIGTAELYRQVEQMPEVLEALAFARDVGDDVEVVLLVRLNDGVALDSGLQKAIRMRIRTGCSPRHVPALIVAVDDLPRTRSGKLAELAVADAVNGRTVRSTEGLADSAALWAAVDRVKAATH
jgi:acetoacetyl-CoA synthetase